MTTIQKRRKSSLTHFPFRTEETEDGKQVRRGGIRQFIPGAAKIMDVTDLGKGGPDENRGCAYSVFFIPTQGISPRKAENTANSGVLGLVRTVYDESTTDGTVIAEELIGGVLQNANGFPVVVNRKVLTWKDWGDTKQEHLKQAVNRQWGSHADANGLFCYGSGMPEAVTRPHEIRQAFADALAYQTKVGRGVAEAVADARIILSQRKDRAVPHHTWDKYLADDGEVLAEPRQEAKPKAKKARAAAAK